MRSARRGRRDTFAVMHGDRGEIIVMGQYGARRSWPPVAGGEVTMPGQARPG